MPQCVVIADDLTGANVSGVLVAKTGLRTYTILSDERLDLSGLHDCDCVVIPTDSRGVSPETAYRRVYSAAKLLQSPEVRVYSKRIDTTLRGNLGSETDAMLDALGEDTLAIAVPCYPSSGRINVGGYLLVNAIPLHRTEAASDPKNPVDTPVCAEIFRRQSKYPVECVYLNEQIPGKKHITARILALQAQGVRTIVFDAVTQGDIDLIADAVIASKVKFAAVDPGVFTSAVARKLIAPMPQKKAKILVAVGSINGVAIRQVEFFLKTQRVLNVLMDTGAFLENEVSRTAEVERVSADILANCGDYDVCSIVGSGIYPERRAAFEPYAKRDNCSDDALSNRINNAIAETVYRIVAADKGFKGLYLCGGDITIAVCRQMKNLGLKLKDEVLPLAEYCEMMGGVYSGLKVVTKGGMVGEQDAIVRCVRFLKEKLNS